MNASQYHKAYMKTARIIFNDKSLYTLRLNDSQINFTMPYIQLNNELKSSLINFS